MIVRLDVVYERPGNALRDGEPALIDSNGERVVVSHARFESSFDPFRKEGTVRCLPSDEAFALEITHRAALSAILPLEDGVLLHSAGIVVDGRAIAFFGPSGAGKSTLASLVDEPVLSDELIAIRSAGEGFVVEATGMWGELEPRAPVEGAFPLAHLIALDRGAGFTIDPLGPAEAARALLGVAMVPPDPALWRPAMNVVSRLAHLRVSRMRWTPSKENAHEVVSELRAGTL